MGILSRLKDQLGKDGFKPDPSVLTHPQIPKPLHGVAPRTVLGKAWWDKERAEAKAKTKGRCLACGEWGFKTPEGFLEGHEEYQIDYEKGRAVYQRAIPLCRSCHQYIHKGLLEVLEEKGIISPEARQAVLDRGDTLLKSVKTTPIPPPAFCASWEDWRLVIDEKEYPPIHKSYEDWLTYYRKD